MRIVVQAVNGMNPPGSTIFVDRRTDQLILEDAGLGTVLLMIKELHAEAAVIVDSPEQLEHIARNLLEAARQWKAQVQR